VLAGALPRAMQVGELPLAAGALAATAVMVRLVDRRSWGDVGLGRAGARGRALGAGAAVGGAPIALACAVLFLAGWLRVVPTLPGSSLLAAVRVAYDSLYAAWAAHVAWNWVMAVPLHAAVSGQWFESPDYRTVSAGPAWITGGGWGPEGGLAAGLGRVAALAFLHWRHRREES